VKEKIVSLINISVTRKAVKEKKTLRWNRSKIILLGKGRVGKTSLAHNIQNISFRENLASTRGSEKYDLKSDFHASEGSFIAGRFVDYCSGNGVTADAVVSASNKNSSSSLESETNANEGIISESVISKKEVAKPVPERNILERSDSSNAQSTAESVNKLNGVEFPNPVGKLQRSKTDSYDEACSSSDEREISQRSETEDDFPRILSENVSLNMKLIISLYDFGGQDIFHVFLPFFMSRNAVYFLVFDLSELLSSDKTKSQSCLMHIRLWLNSITLQSQKRNENNVVMDLSPIALVGCKADKDGVINDEIALKEASTLLQDTFSNHVAWEFLLKLTYGVSDYGDPLSLNFFPIDNKNRDAVSAQSLTQLLVTAEKEIEKFKCFDEEVALSWFLATDAILKEKYYSCFVEYSKVCEVAKSQGVDNCAEVDSLLEFLCDSGILLWINDVDSGLREIVILDPIEYFIKPATRIICKHLPTIDPDTSLTDDTVHSCSPFYQKCREKRRKEWLIMLEYGFASIGLTREVLLEGDENDKLSCCKNEEHFYKVLCLLKKYGLVLSCKLPPALRLNKSENSDREILFFPSLSPINPEYYDVSKINDEKNRLLLMKKRLGLKYKKIQQDFRSEATFYFAFTFSDELVKAKLLSKNDTAVHGFLPSGLFERFVGRLFEELPTTSCNIDDLLDRGDFISFKNCVVFNYLNLRLRIMNLMEYNIFQIDICQLVDKCSLRSVAALGHNNDPVKDDRIKRGVMVLLLDSLYEKVRNLTACTKNLKVIALFPYYEHHPPFSYKLSSPPESDPPLLPFSEVRFIVQEQSSVSYYTSIDVTKNLDGISWEDLDIHFAKWLEIKSILPQKDKYDEKVGSCFFSGVTLLYPFFF
jgi:GTPase SAR1 family protein